MPIPNSPAVLVYLRGNKASYWWFDGKKVHKPAMTPEDAIDKITGDPPTALQVVTDTKSFRYETPRIRLEQDKPRSPF
jgi:hypothetical protein